MLSKKPTQLKACFRGGSFEPFSSFLSLPFFLNLSFCDKKNSASIDLDQERSFFFFERLEEKRKVTCETN